MAMTIVMPAPFGGVGITLVNEKLSRLTLLSEKTKNSFKSSTQTHFSSELLRCIQYWLDAYFKDPSTSTSFFSPSFLITQGTPFQQRVWQALTTIPVGETLSYGQLAKTLNTAPRAIGMACRANPIPLIVPCHRVVSQSGLGGFMGETTGDIVSIKSWLLEHESAANKNTKG